MMMIERGRVREKGESEGMGVFDSTVVWARIPTSFPVRWGVLVENRPGELGHREKGC